MATYGCAMYPLYMDRCDHAWARASGVESRGCHGEEESCVVDYGKLVQVRVASNS